MPDGGSSYTETPTDEDRDEALRRLFRGLCNGDDVRQIADGMFDLQVRHDTFPGEVFMEVGIDALRRAHVGRDRTIERWAMITKIRDEYDFRGSRTGTSGTPCCRRSPPTVASRSTCSTR